MPPAILIVDDDPSHLRIYEWIVRGAGYRPFPALVTRENVELPDEPVSLALLDYHLNSRLNAVAVAGMINTKYPAARIVVLSDVLVLPDDVAPLVHGFVRKGDPAKLVETLSRTLA
ncbi:MAG TPA: hypothetical protein VM865_06180 [Acidobacteriaceae bacterium]|nr:hypothetical protein [Acidobacteriaceae bacterium]